MHSLLARQLRKFFGAKTPAELGAFVAAVEESYAAFESDAQILHRAMEISSQELTQANAEVRAVIEAIPDVILRLDREGNIVPLKAPDRSADPQAHRFNKRRISSNISNLPNPAVRASYQQALQSLMADGQQRTFEYALPSELGENTFEVRMVALKDGHAIAIIQDITKRRQVEAEHARLNQELVTASRQAGMAEVATGVLHNVGNVLNSVNLAAGLVVDQLHRSKTSSLARAVQMLREHRENLSDFLVHDPKGRQLPEFLAAVSEQLTREQTSLLREAQGLQQNVEHIKQIVAVQQSYAKVSAATETLALRDLIEDALRIASAALARSQIEIVREFAPVPPVFADRHMILQILVNLVTNAEQALRDRPEARRLTLRVASGEAGIVRVEVADNGVGIPNDNLARIFNHGFTTKKNGHGFGLHSGANAAKEMGGSLTVQSAGSGTGATFVLALPIRQKSTRPSLPPAGESQGVAA